MKILFRLDFGGLIGMGHLGRCQTLARKFLEVGAEVTFLTRKVQENLMVPTDLLAHPKFTQIELGERQLALTSDVKSWLGVSESQDVQEVMSVVVMQGVDLVVVDHYGVDRDWLRIVGGVAKTLFIADYPSALDSDYLLDYGFDASKHKHGQSKSVLFAGPDFAPVSKEFCSIEKNIEPKLDMPCVLIALGGGAPSRIWDAVITQAKTFLPNFKLRIASPEHLKSHLKRYEGESLEILSAWSPLARGLSGNDGAIVGAGVSFYETLASGLPYIAIVTADNQLPSAQSAISDQAMNLVINPMSDEEFSRASSEFQSQIANPKLTALKSKSVIDCFGVDRLVRRFIQLDEPIALRPFIEPYSSFLLKLANQRSVRNNSFASSDITAKDHAAWLASGGKGRKIWLLFLGEIPVGQCRLEMEGSYWYLHYSIDEHFRSMGLGKRMLRLLLGSSDTPSRVRARVLPQNNVSTHVLESVGFRVIERHDNELVLEYLEIANTRHPNIQGDC